MSVNGHTTASDPQFGTFPEEYWQNFKPSIEIPLKCFYCVQTENISKPAKTAPIDPQQAIKDAKLLKKNIAGLAKLFKLCPPASSTTPKLITPKGLQNPKNKCYINAVLQALVWTPQLCLWLDHVLKFVNRTKTHSHVPPCTKKLLQLFGDLKNTVNRRPVVPSYFYDLLDKFRMQQTAQQDAQEFLTFLLDSTHDEAITAFKDKSSSLLQDKEPEQQGWQTVTGKKTATEEMTSIDQWPKSYISKIYRTYVRSQIQERGKSTSRSNIEPHYTIPIQIHNTAVTSVSTGLTQFLSRQKLQDYKNGATIVTHIHGLPPVLILHLQRFEFGGSVSKVKKEIDYPLSLVMQKEWLSKEIQSSKPIQYKLHAVISHVGHTASSGHYIAQVHCGKGGWITFNDTSVFGPVPDHRRDPEDAYLLFYKRVKC